MKINYKSITTKDVFIVALILAASFGYYLTMLIPEDIQEFDLLLFNIGSSGFWDIRSMASFSRMKVLIIFYSAIWYLTCRNWWKSSILVLIMIELLKLISTVNPNQTSFDEIEFLTSLPITLPIVLLLIYFSNKVNKYNLAKEVRNEIDNEIANTFFQLNSNKKSELDAVRQSFSILKSNKKVMSKKDYFNELINLKNKCQENQ